MVKIIGRVFFFAGCVLIFLSLFLLFQKVSSHPITFSNHVFQKSPQNSQSYLAINDLDIHAQMFPAQWKKGVLISRVDGVSVDRNVLYGHNWKSILGNLNKAKVGMKVEVVRGTRNVETYKIESISEVDPEEVKSFFGLGENRLIIYTCSGLLDSKRLVVVAGLI